MMTYKRYAASLIILSILKPSVLHVSSDLVPDSSSYRSSMVMSAKKPAHALYQACIEALECK